MLARRSTVLLVVGGLALSGCQGEGTLVSGRVSVLTASQVCIRYTDASVDDECYLVTKESHVPPRIAAGDFVEVRGRVEDEGRVLIEIEEVK